MKIGYNKIWGIGFLLFDGLICCLAAVSARTDAAFPPALVAGFWLFLLFGVLFLTRRYIEVYQNNVFIKPLIGFGRKTYPVQSARGFSVEGRTIFVTSNGVRQQLPVSSWLVDGGGWTSLIKWIETSNQQTS